MSLGKEKRSGRRIPIHCPVHIQLADGREMLGMALDVSVEGIRFDCPIALAPAQEAELRLQPANAAIIPPLQAAIEVIRCETTESPDRFIIAAALRVTR